MVGKTNVGGAKAYATIGVTYPSGSTLTCTNGSTTLTAANTNGAWAFHVPSSGTWTVKAVKDSQSKSQSVSITAEGQFESVELSYRYYVFESGKGYQNGHTLTKIRGNFSLATDNSYIELDDNSSSAYFGGYFEPAIDVSKYSTLYIDCKKNTTAAQNAVVGLSSSKLTSTSIESTSNYLAYTTLSDVDNSTRKTVALAISAVSSSCYISWFIKPLYIYNLWLE